MRIAVVGNGPSAKGQARAIDACDFVVRCNQFRRVFKNGSAGKKLNAFAWAGYAKNNNLVPRGRGWQMWITCPWKWHKGPRRRQNVHKIASTRHIGVVAIDLSLYRQVRACLKRASKKDLPPSTGILAVAMVVCRIKPEELFVVGFDAGLTGIYRYADGRPGSNSLHAYAAEAGMLSSLAEGQWMGKEVPIKLTWRKP